MMTTTSITSWRGLIQRLFHESARRQQDYRSLFERGGVDRVVLSELLRAERLLQEMLEGWLGGERGRSRVDDLIAAGFAQVSRRYRLLARVPPGKTAIEALSEVDPIAAKDIAAHAEERAGERYRRVHARGDDRAELTDEEFREYLKKTGRATVL